METPAIESNGTSKKAQKGTDSAPEQNLNLIKQWTVDVTCEQLSPLLCDSMPEEEVWNILHGGNRPPKNTTATRHEVASLKVYRNPETEKLGLPTEMLFACLRGAGRKVKVGRSALSTLETTQLPAFLTIEDTFIDFLEEDPHWVPDVRRGMMKSGTTKTACAICRPKFTRWSFKVRISIDLEGVDGLLMDHVKQLFMRAGRSQGLGSFRPSCNGPFGRFKITDWQQVPYKD